MNSQQEETTKNVNNAITNAGYGEWTQFADFGVKHRADHNIPVPAWQTGGYQRRSTHSNKHEHQYRRCRRAASPRQNTPTSTEQQQRSTVQPSIEPFLGTIYIFLYAITTASVLSLVYSVRYNNRHTREVIHGRLLLIHPSSSPPT